MNAKLPPLPDIEQVIYEKCRRFVTADVEKAVEEIVREQSLLAVREALERAAVCAWSTGMDKHNKTAGMPCDAREVGSLCANNIRALLKEYGDE